MPLQKPQSFDFFIKNRPFYTLNVHFNYRSVQIIPNLPFPYRLSAIIDRYFIILQKIKYFNYFLYLKKENVTSV